MTLSRIATTSPGCYRLCFDSFRIDLMYCHFSLVYIITNKCGWDICRCVSAIVLYSLYIFFSFFFIHCSIKTKSQQIIGHDPIRNCSGLNKYKCVQTQLTFFLYEQEKEKKTPNNSFKWRQLTLLQSENLI